MRLAEARFSASSMMSCSMRASLIGEAWVWMRKTSVPRTLSFDRK
jgi:hypothetical protein